MSVVVPSKELLLQGYVASTTLVNIRFTLKILLEGDDTQMTLLPLSHKGSGSRKNKKKEVVLFVQRSVAVLFYS